MTTLEWLLNFIGIAICTQIHPVSAQNPEVSAYDGNLPVHIVVEGGEQKHITLQKISTKFSSSFFKPKKANELDYSKGVRVPLQFELPWHTPVLDQGAYGTCVTFASTATADQVLGAGDTIAQQCVLQLNSSLGNNYWNGAYYSSQVLQPLKDYGIVTKAKCPQSYPNPFAPVSVESYKALADKSLDVNRINYLYYPSASVEIVKSELAKGHYINIGFGLLNNGNPISVQGYDVVVEGKKSSGGLWACKQGILSKSYCGSATAGHEVVVYGYDDSQRLFKIRNSWSDRSGYKGDFFMSYEFFASMVMDATAVW
jgi:hypothetical protein